MSRTKKILIGVGVVVLLAAAGRREFLFQARNGDTRSPLEAGQDARPRGHRLGVRQDSGEALREHERGADGTRHAARRGRGRPRQGGPVPARDRSQLAARHRGTRRGRSRGGALGSGAGARQRRDRPGQPRARAGPGQPPARALEAGPDDARDARPGGEPAEGA